MDRVCRNTCAGMEVMELKEKAQVQKMNESHTFPNVWGSGIQKTCLTSESNKLPQNKDCCLVSVIYTQSDANFLRGLYGTSNPKDSYE